MTGLKHSIAHSFKFWQNGKIMRCGVAAQKNNVAAMPEPISREEAACNNQELKKIQIRRPCLAIGKAGRRKSGPAASTEAFQGLADRFYYRFESHLAPPRPSLQLPLASAAALVIYYWSGEAFHGFADCFLLQLRKSHLAPSKPSLQLPYPSAARCAWLLAFRTAFCTVLKLPFGTSKAPACFFVRFRNCRMAFSKPSLHSFHWLLLLAAPGSLGLPDSFLCGCSLRLNLICILLYDRHWTDIFLRKYISLKVGRRSCFVSAKSFSHGQHQQQVIPSTIGSCSPTLGLSADRHQSTK